MIVYGLFMCNGTRKSIYIYIYIYYILCLYFYIINISYDKTYFTCILINLSRLKIIITSNYIENMKIT